MPEYRYLLLDVFTKTPFSGNQLAVLPESSGLSSEQMQTIANEFNLPETSFVFESELKSATANVRIFTPQRELPMAGHPTIGTCFALAHEKLLSNVSSEIILELKVGPTQITLEWSGEHLSSAWMTQNIPEFGKKNLDPNVLSRLLTLDPGEIGVPDLPAQIVSSGVPFLFVPIANRSGVDKAVLDRTALLNLCDTLDSPELPVYIFSLEKSDDEATSYSRMFAPVFGITEDPATGSASGPLGGYLHNYNALPYSKLKHFINYQGYKMNRPSNIHISVDVNGEEINMVKIGGSAILIGHGKIMV